MAEDAIASTVEGLQKASQAVVDRLIDSWNKRVDHENRKIHEQLDSGQQGLQTTIDDVRGVGVWGDLLDTTAMNKRLTTREESVSGLLEEAMAMVGK